MTQVPLNTRIHVYNVNSARSKLRKLKSHYNAASQRENTVDKKKLQTVHATNPTISTQSGNEAESRAKLSSLRTKHKAISPELGGTGWFSIARVRIGAPGSFFVIVDQRLFIFITGQEQRNYGTFGGDLDRVSTLQDTNFAEMTLHPLPKKSMKFSVRLPRVRRSDTS